MKQVEKSQNTLDLEQKPLRSLLLHYTIPSLVGTMVVAMYNVVDRIFIGQGVGEFAIAGLTLTFPILIFLQAFGMLIGVGASSRVSIALGQKDSDGAEKILGNAIFLTLISQVLTIIPTLIFLEPLLRMFGGSERTIPFAVEYLQIVVPGHLFSTLCFSYNSIMRASGYPKKAMYTMLIGAVINTVLDAVFVYVFDWGIAGVAWATVIAMIVSAAFVMWHFFKKSSSVHFERKNMVFSLPTILSIVSIGLSPFAVQLLGSLVTILFNRSFISVSENSVQADLCIAAYGVINSYAMIAVMFILGVAQGMQPIVGYNFGAGLYERVRRTFKVCAWVNTGAAFLFSVFALLFPYFVVRIFTNSPTLIDVSTHAVVCCLFGFTFVGYQITATQFLQSLGLAKDSFILSISRQSFFLIPLILILPQMFGLDAVWYSSAYSDILAGLLGIFMINRVMNRVLVSKVA